MEKSPNRLTFIDVARTYAIILALLAHALITTGAIDKLGADSIYIKQFIRMATPMFVFMFGFMVEFIYVKRASNCGVKQISRRLYVRSFQCFVAYVLTSMCAWLGGYKSLESVVNSIIFLSEARFGNILRAYCVMLLVTPFIIKLRLKIGVKLLYFALVLLLILHAFISHLQTIDFGILNHPMNILFGIGIHQGGPSVIGAFIFYLAGMIVAAGVGRGDLNPKEFYKSIASLFVVMLVAGAFLIQDNLYDTWRFFSNATYRKLNDPGYYIIGTCCSLLAIAVCYALIGNRKLIKPLSFILPIGTSSLISYTVGNMLLNLFGQYSQRVELIVFLVVFFSAVVLITRNITSMPFYNKAFTLMNLEYRKAFQRTSR